jgi:3-hydroxyisobutyrate dehydrogenase
MIQADSISANTKRIGWIGTGVMGAAMAGHLCRAGHKLFVYNRSRAKARPLLDLGASWRESPGAVAEACEILFTIVGYPHDVREVYLGADGVLTRATDALRIVVDMTTSQPALAREIARLAAAKNIRALDAPVSGGDVGAREARLAIMVGGEAAAFEQCRPLFEAMGQTVALMGPAGAGQATKLANQILVAGNMIGACEALLYARRAGLDQQAVIDVIGKGAAGSWTINHLGPRMARRDFAAGFFVEHFVKDMGIVLEECERMNLALPGLALVRQLYVALKAQGHGRSGTQALLLALEKWNALDPGWPDAETEADQ